MSNIKPTTQNQEPRAKDLIIKCKNHKTPVYQVKTLKFRYYELYRHHINHPPVMGNI